MRGHLEVAEREGGVGTHLKSGAIAIVPGRRRVDRQLRLQLELRCATQTLARNGRLDGELVLVAGVLVVASATMLKIGTGWLDTLGRWFKDVFQLRAGESGLFFQDRSSNLLAFEHEWDK